MTATAAADDVWAALAPPASTPSTDEAVERDRYDRYLIPHPETGKVRPWTRATTVAETLADRFGLEQWDQRNIVLGIGRRRDLYEQAVACTAEDKKTLKDIVRQAKAAAAAESGANSGTARHRLTERYDAGELDLGQVADPELRADVEAYIAQMTAAQVRVARDGDTRRPWIERVLIVPDLEVDGVAGVAGTADRLCLSPAWPLPRIGDLKTGKDVARYGMDAIPLQLAIYAHASHWYDPATRQLHPMPPVDQERAVVMHLPVGSANCQLYEVDIAAGWEAVQSAVYTRTWRKRARGGDLARIITVPGPVPATATPAPAPTRPDPGNGTGDRPAAGVVPGVQPTAPEATPAATTETPCPSTHQHPKYGLLRCSLTLEAHEDHKARWGLADHGAPMPGSTFRVGWRDEDPAPAATTSQAVVNAAASWIRGQARTIAAATPAHTLSDQPDDAAPDGRIGWLRDRIQALIDAGHEPVLVAAWPQGVPTPRQGGLTNGHVDTLAATLSATEALYEMPFGDRDPAAPVAPQLTVATPPGPEGRVVDLMGAIADSVDRAKAERGEKAKVLLAQFDEAEQRAIAACAMAAPGTVTAERLERLEAVVGQLADPTGAVMLAYGPDGPQVVPTAEAAALMAAAAGQGGGAQRAAALGRAKRLAEDLGLPKPRSLPKAAESALLAALVASGHGAAPDNTPTTSNDGKQA